MATRCSLKSTAITFRRERLAGLESVLSPAGKSPNLVEVGKIHLSLPREQWLEMALSYPSIRLLELSPQVAVESTRLPGQFHRDPADQIIVATARLYTSPLVTMDQKIRAYAHVQVAP